MEHKEKIDLVNVGMCKTFLRLPLDMVVRVFFVKEIIIRDFGLRELLLKYIKEWEDLNREYCPKKSDNVLDMLFDVILNTYNEIVLEPIEGNIRASLIEEFKKGSSGYFLCGVLRLYARLPVNLFLNHNEIFCFDFIMENFAKDRLKYEIYGYLYERFFYNKIENKDIYDMQHLLFNLKEELLSCMIKQITVKEN